MSSQPELGLPVIFETIQGKAWSEAFHAGQLDKARKIKEHLIAEAATTPSEQEEIRETIRSAELFTRLFRAREAGNTVGAEFLEHMILETCSPEVIRRNLGAALLQAGMREGLTAEQHRRLVELTEGTGEEIKKLVAKIEIRDQEV